MLAEVLQEVGFATKSSKQKLISIVPEGGGNCKVFALPPQQKHVEKLVK